MLRNVIIGIVIMNTKSLLLCAFNVLCLTLKNTFCLIDDLLSSFETKILIQSTFLNFYFLNIHRVIELKFQRTLAQIVLCKREKYFLVLERVDLIGKPRQKTLM